jgi:hypothetical protein
MAWHSKAGMARLGMAWQGNAGIFIFNKEKT